MRGNDIAGEFLMSCDTLSSKLWLDLRIAAEHSFYGMREGRVAKVMQEARQPDFFYILARKTQMAGHAPSHMHGSQRMLKPCMICSRIYGFYEAELLYALQPLHWAR
ncbi:Uncharacterised protein [uncultured archaeon]|nr:Uncharacterised protein [uncultured archaeon]